ncbi:MAG TPA: AMP-binding protein [Gaiellaceae bacterium]|nr:AMP-binding protein [Gaiellaceae bacterium]
MAERNLARAADETFARLGDYESLWFDGRWIRSGELHDRAARLAGWLRDEGLEPGDRVVVLMANCPEVPIAYNAIWRAGGVVTPAIFLLPPAELEHIVSDSGASLVLATPELAGNVPDGVRIVTTDELGEADPAEIVPRAPEDPAALLYTGGTTGRSKGVLLSHENLWFAGKSGHDAGHLPEITRGLLALPLSHAYGLLVTVVGLHAEERGQTALMRWFDPALWLELAQEHRTQITAVVPSMLQLLLAQQLEDYDLSELRYVVSGGAPLPTEVAEELLRRLSQVEIREGYGLTESSAIVTSTPPGGSRLGSVGQAAPGVEIRIDGDDEVGEICVRSSGVMLGYWGQPEATAEAIEDGWLRTGDLGYLDEDGYLYVVDRKKDLIIRGGFNVFPRDVEEAMLEHPAVAGAGVVGRPDAAHGEEVVAFVELAPGAEATADDLVAYGKKRIGGYKYPREVHLVGSLPLTHVGKVDRKALRAKLLEEAPA